MNVKHVRTIFWFSLCVSLITGAFAKEKSEDLPVDLSVCLEIPKCWSVTSADIDKNFEPGDDGVAEWVDEDKTRVIFSRNRFRNIELDLTLLDGDLPIEEAVLDFEKGSLDVITLSVFNRGDAGHLKTAVFKSLHQKISKTLSQQLKTKARPIKASKQQGLLFEGDVWKSANSIAVMEYNEGAMSGKKLEFLRVRIAKKGSRSALAKAMLNERGGASVRLSELTKQVKKDKEGNIYVDGLPMVDQGNKGYCVVASVQRLFEHYGIGADMHQLAYVAGSDPKRGTSSMQMAKEIGEIDFRFKTRLDILAMTTRGGELVKVGHDFKAGRPVDEKKFFKVIRSNIKAGIPLLWSLRLGDYPEVPNLRPQTSGYHMRMIIGYNDKQKKIIFSDSWGAGHAFKTMAMGDAYNATTGLFLLKPTVR